MTLSNILPLAIVPGPKAPKDYNSFLQPLVDEFKQLSLGNWAFDAFSNETFKLHAYLISFHGDMVATKHVMNFKGPNGISPCSLCLILGIWNLQGTTTHYVPHTPPFDQPSTHGTYWDTWETNLQSDSGYFDTLLKMDSLQEHSGINGNCVLMDLPSISITCSFPHDWMHLCIENHLKNLVALWQGQYKGLDEGRENYCIPNNIWERIGQETAMAGDTIPSSFGCHTPNVWTEKYLFTAEDWAFWMIHLAPHVLKDRFTHPKYYKHFMKFNSILKHTIQYSFTEQELDELEQDIIKYVKEYERCASFVLWNFSVSIFIFIFFGGTYNTFSHYSIYYQFSAKRLATL